MGKKVMYTHLPQDEDGESSSYFGKSVLKAEDSDVKTGWCKCSLCKVLCLVLLVIAVSACKYRTNLRCMGSGALGCCRQGSHNLSTIPTKFPNLVMVMFALTMVASAFPPNDSVACF